MRTNRRKYIGMECSSLLSPSAEAPSRNGEWPLLRAFLLREQEANRSAGYQTLLFCCSWPCDFLVKKARTHVQTLLCEGVRMEPLKNSPIMCHRCCLLNQCTFISSIVSVVTLKVLSGAFDPQIWYDNLR